MTDIEIEELLTPAEVASDVRRYLAEQAEVRS